MPSLRKNRLGIYFLDVYVNGKRRRLSLQTRDRRAAILAMRTTIGENRIDPPAQAVTFEAFEKHFFEWMAPPRISQGTYLNFRSALNRLRVAHPDIPRLDGITFPIAEKYILAIARKRAHQIDGHPVPMTTRGVNWHIRTLRRMFGFAKERGFCQENVFARIEKYPEESIEPKALARKELLAFFKEAAASDRELVALFFFYLLTGVRLSEALRLRWEWIEWDAESIKIMGKGRKFRIVPMLPGARAILQNRRHLPSPFGGVGSPSTISHRFTAIKRASGLHGYKLHDLRKTFGTMLTEYNISQSYIQKWLGHEDGRITMTHYIGRHDRETKKKLAAFQKDLLKGKIGEIFSDAGLGAL